MYLFVNFDTFDFNIIKLLKNKTAWTLLYSMKKCNTAAPEKFNSFYLEMKNCYLNVVLENSAIFNMIYYTKIKEKVHNK